MKDTYVSVAGVRITGATRLIWPNDGYTKLDLADYFLTVARPMLRYLHQRPLSFKCFPEGVGGPFYHLTERPQRAPAWLAAYGQSSLLVARDLRALVWAAQRCCIEVCSWLSRVDSPERPDFLVVDLQPAGEAGFDLVVAAARAWRHRLDRLSLESFPVLDGGQGIYVLVPLAPVHPFSQVHEFVHQQAQSLEKELPELMSTDPIRARELGLVLVDCAANAFGRTALTPYSPRALAGAPVAAPVLWHELDDPELRPDRYTINNMRRRLDESGDLLGPAYGLDQRLPRWALA